MVTVFFYIKVPSNKHTFIFGYVCLFLYGFNKEKSVTMRHQPRSGGLSATI